MSLITFDPAEVPKVELETPAPQRRRRTAEKDRLAAAVHLPMVLSVGVNLIFLVVHWVPEAGQFPTRDGWLTQLVPLASKEVTSAGEPVVDAQAGRSGLIAGFFLVAGLLLPLLARSPHWSLRVVCASALLYAALVGWVVTSLSLLGRGQLVESRVGLLLMTVWVGCAAATVWRGVWLGPLTQRRQTRVPWLLLLYAAVGLVPLAVGRWLFAPDQRDVAEQLLAGRPIFRLSVLVDPSTVALYLCGVCIGVLVWAARAVLTQIHRRRDRTRSLGALAAVALLLAVIGPVAHASADRRVATLTQTPPLGAFRCGSWQDPAGPTPRTLALEGADCSRVTTLEGYRTTAEQALPGPARPTSPVQARVYGRTLALVTTDRRDGPPTALLGLRIADGRLTWRYACPDGALGSVTLGRRLDVECGGRTVRLDPANGRRLR